MGLSRAICGYLEPSGLYMVIWGFEFPRFWAMVSCADLSYRPWLLHASGRLRCAGSCETMDFHSGTMPTPSLPLAYHMVNLEECQPPHSPPLG